MTSIGGRPILVQTLRRFSIAPAATTACVAAATASRRAVKLVKPATEATVAEFQTRGDKVKSSDLSYGEWVAANPSASRLQRTVALQKHLLHGMYDHHASNTMYDFHSCDDLARPRTCSPGAPAVGEVSSTAAGAQHAIAAATRASRQTAGGQPQRVKAIQHFLHSTHRGQQSRAVLQIPHRWKENDMVVSQLQREPSFGLYNSGSSDHGVPLAVFREFMPMSAVAKWAVTTVDDRPIFSVSRWLQQSSAAARQDPAARRAAVQKFLDQTRDRRPAE